MEGEDVGPALAEGIMVREGETMNEMQTKERPEVSNVEVLDEVRRLFSKLTAIPDRMWTTVDCANYMQCSESAMRRMMKQPGFPLPIRPQTDSTGTRLPARYVPDEVRDWALRRSNRAS